MSKYSTITNNFFQNHAFNTIIVACVVVNNNCLEKLRGNEKNI